MLAARMKIERPGQANRGRVKTQHGIETLICFHSPTPHAEAVSFGRDSRPFVRLKSEHTPRAPFSHVRLRLWENPVTSQPRSTACNHPYWRSCCCLDDQRVLLLCGFHLDLIHFTGGFPSKIFFFFFSPVRVLLFCNRRVFNIGQVKCSIEQFSARELVSSMIQW